MSDRFGPYLLLKLLGQGAMGDAHLALPLASRRHLPSPLVIKRLHAKLNHEAHYLRRFQHEASIATRIESPHVPRVYEVGTVGETFYIAMELIKGWQLAHVIQDLSEKGQRPSLNSTLEIVTDVLKGLASLHGARDDEGAPLSVVHRDVSPKNLIVGEDGITRVIDLGLGRSAWQDWKTRTGAVMGTPGYMAPEQILAKGVDHRSDLYAVGAVLWELLTGGVYIDRGRIAAMLIASLAPKFRPPSTMADVPPALDEVARLALEHDPAERFQSAEAFLAALAAAVPSEGERAPISSLIGQILWQELADSTTENRRLMEAAREEPVVDPPSEMETVVVARRETIGTEFPPTLPPSRTEVDTVLRPTRMVSPKSKPPPPARWKAPLALAAVAAAALAVGIWIGGRGAPIVAAPAPIESPTAAPVTLAPVARQIVEPARVGVPARVPAKTRPLRKIEAPAPPPAPPPPPPPAPSSRDDLARALDESPQEWADRLVRTALAWRRAEAPESARYQSLSTFVAKVASVRASGGAKQESELTGLASELRALRPR